MSLLPLFMDFVEGLADSDYENGFEDDFGFGIYPNDVIGVPQKFRRNSRISQVYRRQIPYNLSKKLLKSTKPDFVEEEKKIPLYSSVGKDGFQVLMNVQQFKPNELTVKVVNNNICVEGKHEEREDNHGMIFRHFVRKYALPKGYDLKAVVSTLSSDGILTIKAPPPSKLSANSERIIEIQHTGPAHLTVKDNKSIPIPITIPTPVEKSADVTMKEIIQLEKCENGETDENIKTAKTVEKNENGEKIENGENIENAKAVEKIENGKSNENGENIESAKKVEKTENGKSSENGENVENAKKVEKTENVKSNENGENIENTSEKCEKVEIEKNEKSDEKMEE